MARRWPAERGGPDGPTPGSFTIDPYRIRKRRQETRTNTVAKAEVSARPFMLKCFLYGPERVCRANHVDVRCVIWNLDVQRHYGSRPRIRQLTSRYSVQPSKLSLSTVQCSSLFSIRQAKEALLRMAREALGGHDGGYKFVGG